MKCRLLLLLMLCVTCSVRSQSTETFHDFSALTIHHDTLPLSNYAGKKVLVVNTASFCSFTYEYADLVDLDSLYGGPDFAIIGFPCNDFGGQEPYDDSTIYAFATNNFNVHFQMMSKISITAPDTAEVYKWLQLQNRNGVANAPVTWNFHKFCIDEAGHWIRHFPSSVNPLDTAITNWIQSPNTSGIARTEFGDVRLYGNPMRQQIRLDVDVVERGSYAIRLLDTQGRLVENLFEGELNSSTEFLFEPADLAGGFYFLNVQSRVGSKTIRIAYLN